MLNVIDLVPLTQKRDKYMFIMSVFKKIVRLPLIFFQQNRINIFMLLLVNLSIWYEDAASELVVLCMWKSQLYVKDSVVKIKTATFTQPH